MEVVILVEESETVIFLLYTHGEPIKTQDVPSGLVTRKVSILDIGNRHL